ncbi:hypothetical protein T4C_12128 [Trichinella pseudospiralis]|uniref:Uncharacterized protein n=1 Tax=Trichinella pseudospiralis TaxID=6337 RepID=A0A0V1K4L1_TRIPS|nr:hypothetical protein T4C_12128 [Trichinella pseudospiralis]
MIAFYLSLEHTLHFAAHVQVVLRSCHLPRNESGKCSFVLSMQAVFIVATLLFDCGCICVVRCVTINEMHGRIWLLTCYLFYFVIVAIIRQQIDELFSTSSSSKRDDDKKQFHFYVF